MEIDWELKKSKKLKKGSYWDIIFKHLPVFVNVLKNTNKLIVLYYPTSLPILEIGAALKEQAIDFSVLQFSI